MSATEKDRDGNDGLSNIANVASNIPVEQAETQYPVRIERYGFVRDSGGAGKFRGGLAIEREWTLLGPAAGLRRSTLRPTVPATPPLRSSGTGTVAHENVESADLRADVDTRIGDQFPVDEVGDYHFRWKPALHSRLTSCPGGESLGKKTPSTEGALCGKTS